MMINSKRMGWEGQVACMGEMRNACKILAEKPEMKRPLGKPRRRWEDNIIWVLGKEGGKVWTGCVWLRNGTSGGIVRTE
jgi:hypothetical protein